MGAYIRGINYHLPSRVITNQELSGEFPEWPPEKIESKLGIRERHIAGEGACASDLGVESAQALFRERSVKPEEVDFLLFCTQSPDYFLPTTACVMQERLGIPKTAGALDFNLGCSGFVYGLGLAKGLVEGGMATRVLLVTSETYSKFMHPKDKSVRTLFGDAAAATLVTNDGPGGQILDFVFGTDGSGARNLMVKAGGLRHPKSQDTSRDYTDEFGNVTNDESLFMNGAEIFTFSLREVPRAVDALLAKTGLSKEQVDLFVLHQANKYMMDALKKKMKIPEEKFFIHISQVGNTVSSTIPIALSNAGKEGRLKPGSKVVLVGFGVGYSWASCLIRY